MAQAEKLGFERARASLEQGGVARRLAERAKGVEKSPRLNNSGGYRGDLARQWHSTPLRGA